MDIETFLGSTNARALLGALLEFHRKLKVPYHREFKDGEFRCCVDVGDFWAWKQVQLFSANERRLVAYYRPDGDRFIVSDLGEGVKALRLRTGFLFDDIVRRFVSDKTEHFQGAFGMLMDATLLAGNWERGWVGEVAYHEPIVGEQLPDAICRVLLASLKVANLTERGMG
jgi:hypothetical protein